MEAVEDALYLDPAKRADIEEYTFSSVQTIK